MQNSEELDWDYYEYGAQEIEQQKIANGIAQFKKQTIFSQEIKDEDYNCFEISQNMDDLQEKLGIFAKESQITKQAGNLKTLLESEISKEIHQFSKNIPTYPEKIKNTLLSGKETRTKTGNVVDTFPKTAIGIVLAHFQNGNIIRGTGSLCGPNHVITAAHIFKSSNNNKLTKVQFIPGVINQKTQFKEPKIAKIILYDNMRYRDLILKEPIGFFTGWFGLAALSDEVLKQQKIQLIGYPTDETSQNIEIQHTSTGKISEVEKNHLNYKLDATSGQNGSPLIAVKEINENISEMYIVGIHVGRETATMMQSMGSKKSCNVGSRINLEKLKKLRKIIEFHFLQNSLKEEFFKVIIDSQKQFSADLSKTNASQQVISNLLFAVRYNVQLQELNLKIQNIQQQPAITDHALEELSTSLLQLRKLKFLKTDFYNCQQLTDQGLKQLGQGFSNLKSLQNFFITISQNQEISDRGVNHLFENLHNLHEIKSVSIVLYSLQNLTDETGKNLGANLQKMHTLNSLKIDLKMMPKIGEQGIRDLIDCVYQIKGLETLQFIFTGINYPSSLKEWIKKKFKHIKQFTLI
ncbi:Trypsin-like cysteine/serine peptidase domain [Pseudocohnilembus persalinus]|uniref:Serine protease n=1 Tax=Pseudocohnilembus persalinus TaxID=266149 RepID=A0A0V0QP39_PSEPJ|nr:Trypsin-like cysteine/serine peptidase domain [Pseudocohnilembus persalinus]|eukprot:KRX04073.1 Trypsin-like cysteine/serine peptidase domain [Pseudocohnilembus persalinus]